MPQKLPDGSRLDIRAAVEKDVPLILSLIRQLAEFEKLSHEVVCTEEKLRRTLFGEKPYAEVRIARADFGEGDAFTAVPASVLPGCGCEAGGNSSAGCDVYVELVQVHEIGRQS